MSESATHEGVVRVGVELGIQFELPNEGHAEPDDEEALVPDKQRAFVETVGNQETFDEDR